MKIKKPHDEHSETFKRGKEMSEKATRFHKYPEEYTGQFSTVLRNNIRGQQRAAGFAF